MGMPDYNERPSVRFYRIDVAKAEAVADFILWLCYCNRAVDPTTDDPIQRDERPDPDKQIEDWWFFDGPRHRMAKLLWQRLQGSRSEEHFQSRFLLHQERLTNDCFDCGPSLGPIQTRLRKVIQACSDRRKEDEDIGQGAWGEAFWLPPEYGEYVRRRIRRARLDLIEQAANYPSATRFGLNYLVIDVVKGIQVPSTAVDRIYRGYYREESNSRRVLQVVEIEADGELYPLINGREPTAAPGYNFSWGYGGGGPYALAIRCFRKMDLFCIAMAAACRLVATNLLVAIANADGIRLVAPYTIRTAPRRKPWSESGKTFRRGHKTQSFEKQESLRLGVAARNNNESERVGNAALHGCPRPVRDHGRVAPAGSRCSHRPRGRRYAIGRRSAT